MNKECSHSFFFPIRVQTSHKFNKSHQKLLFHGNWASFSTSLRFLLPSGSSGIAWSCSSRIMPQPLPLPRNSPPDSTTSPPPRLPKAPRHWRADGSIVLSLVLTLFSTGLAVGDRPTRNGRMERPYTRLLKFCVGKQTELELYQHGAVAVGDRPRFAESEVGSFAPALAFSFLLQDKRRAMQQSRSVGRTQAHETVCGNDIILTTMACSAYA